MLVAYDDGCGGHLQIWIVYRCFPADHRQSNNILVTSVVTFAKHKLFLKHPRSVYYIHVAHVADSLFDSVCQLGMVHLTSLYAG